MKNKVIVRADDLGFCEGINYGIEKAVRDGIVKSVGIMTNMEATQHGYNLIKDLDLCLGLHTNICAGKPITDPKLIPSICDENGYFLSSKVYRSAKEDIVNYDEVVIEIEAQYQRFVELTGRKPDYFECHAVSSKNFDQALFDVCQKQGCDFLPLKFEGSVMFRNTEVTNSFESMYPDYQPFEALKRACLKDVGEKGIVAMICHPGYLDEYILTHSSMTRIRPMETDMLSCDKTKKWLEENHIEVITYKDLA